MLISTDEINKSVVNKGWNYKNKQIFKSYKFNTYMEGIEFTNQVAELAEKNNHHPEVLISWCKIEIFISSHELGGVTTKCINLAMNIDLI